MHRTPRTQSDRSLLHICATSALAVGIVVCAVSTAYSFSVGPLPGENCFGSTTCNLAKILAPLLYEEVHQKITDEALKRLKFTPSSGGAPVQFTKQALVDIKDGNASTDYLQGSPELHFDNASLVHGGNRLIEGKEYLIAVLSPPYILTAKDGFTLRRVLGSYLHTLQDFYAHSNYVNLATPPSIKLGVDLPPTQPLLTFPCQLLSTSDLSLEGLNGLLTTGWANLGGPFLQLALALPGQCAHGLNNGIHKDWQGRDGHEQAFTYAVDASYEFVRSIVTDPSITNKNNVCIFMSGKPCDTSATCPDPLPNVVISGGGRIVEPTPVVSFTNTNPQTGATMSATGSKGNVLVSASVPATPTGGTAQISASYKDTFIVTSPGKSGPGQLLLSVSGSNTAEASCGTKEDSTAQTHGSSVAGYSDGVVAAGGSFLVGKTCGFLGGPTTENRDSILGTSGRFTYGASHYIEVVVGAFAHTVLSHHLATPSSASSTGGISYSITVPSDPDAKVTWCRAAP